MDFIKDLDSNSFLLIPSNIKDKILDYIDDNRLLLNIKIISFNDLKKGLLFDYDNKTIYSLMNKENISYGLSKDLIKNMYYLTEDKYKVDKLNKLLELKNYLLDNNLLIKDELFKDLLKSKNKIYVYGFDYITKFNNYLLDLSKEYIDVEIINKEVKEYEHVVHKAKTMEDEVLYVAEEIAKLINQGIPLNKIYITGLNEEYDFTIRRIFKAYNIPYFIKNENILYDTAISKYFFNNLNDNINDLFKEIERVFDINNNESNKVIYDKLFSLVNKYYWASSYLDVKDIMIEEAKTTTLPSVHMEQEITLTNIYDNIFNDDEYVFLMNFNQGVFPKIKKDEDYIDDKIKPNILENTNELNIIYKDTLVNSIKSIKNLTITYKLSSLFDSYMPSYLVKEYFKEEDIRNYISNYSNDINKLAYAKKLDNLIKFKIDDELLPNLNNHYKINSNEYDNKFTGLNTHIEGINYSYSSMSNYFKCPFRFYCNNVLYINEFTKNNNLFIGSLFHYVLEICLTDNTKDIDEVYDKFINDNNNLPDDDRNKYIFNKKDTFFIEKVRQEIHTIMDIIKEQYEQLDPGFTEWHEKEVLVKTQDIGLDTKTNATIKGFVDKCIVVENDVFVIDYKTGTSDEIKRETFDYGLHIQLPIYMYLLETINPELNVAGIYLQHILTGNNKKDVKKTQLELRKNELKLDGIYNPAYTNEIASINPKDIMTTSAKREYTIEEKEDIKNSIKNLMVECINDVYDAKFDIKPINLNDGKEDGCKFCPFRDVCYKKESDYNYLYTTEGDDNNE